MDYVVRRHAEYRELVSSGVRCGKLHSGLTAKNRWHVQCFMDDLLTDRPTAKIMVEAFVRSQWDATLVSFYVKQGAKRGEFWCMFSSFAL